MTKKLLRDQTTRADGRGGHHAEVDKLSVKKTNSDQAPRSFGTEHISDQFLNNRFLPLVGDLEQRLGVPEWLREKVNHQRQSPEQALEEASIINRFHDPRRSVASELLSELPGTSNQSEIRRDRTVIEMASYRDPGDRRVLDINTLPPFSSPIAGRQACYWGVVKITNIPYSVTIQEVSHFIGRLSRSPLLTPHIHGFPIHIVIERPTGKTLEVFVEFHTTEDAHACVLLVENSVLRGKLLKIGQRHVGVKMSDQGELMSMLFPRAKCVDWDPSTGTPHVREKNNQLSEGFRGFFTVEEMASIVKHAETPQRSPFSARCMQRTYESMISTLYKFPWLSANRYTVAARDFLFTSYMAQLRVLVSKVAPTDEIASPYGSRGSGPVDREVGLNHNLLMDFLFAGLNAVCFSMRQKWQITVNCGPLGNGFPLSQHAFAWPFQCLLPAHDTSDMALEFWLNILVDGFEMVVDNKLNHGFEKYIKVQRDNSGFMLVDFTSAGHGLHFQDAIILEQTLMGLMVEKGRMRWCVDNRVPYQSLNISQYVPKFKGEDLESTLERLVVNDSEDHGMESTKEHNCNKLSVDQLLGRDEAPLNDERPIDSEAFGSQFDTIDRALELFQIGQSQTEQQMHHATAPEHLTYIRRSPPKGPKNFTIDPRTPEFVPSQTWSGVRQSAPEDDVFDDGDTLEQPAASVLRSPFPNQLLPQRSPVCTSQRQNSMRQDEYNGSVDSDITLVSHTHAQSPVRSRSVSDHAVEKQPGLISTASRSHARRKTINVDTTIDEEMEGASYEHTSGVHLKSYSEDLRSSTRCNY